MKSSLSMYIAAVTLFAALAVPLQLAAHESHDQKPRHHHYKLIDLGTFGGPMSFINPTFNSVPALNSHGTTVGGSATSTPTTSTSNFFVCGGPLGAVSNVFHAFAWQNGNVSDLGALPPEEENCSDAGSVNANGEISGTSEIGDIDPVLGVRELRALLWKQGDIINLGTLGGRYSIGGAAGAFGINSHGQVVGGTFSCADGTHSRAFLWENGTMIDLDTLVPAGSPLQLVEAWAINNRGEIAGNGVPPGVARKDFNTLGHAFLLIPCDENHDDSECEGEGEGTSVARGETNQKPNVVLPENVRRMLHQRLGSRYHIPGLGTPKN